MRTSYLSTVEPYGWNCETIKLCETETHVLIAVSIKVTGFWNVAPTML
jgi:hypothetical protein